MTFYPEIGNANFNTFNCTLWAFKQQLVLKCGCVLLFSCKRLCPVHFRIRSLWWQDLLLPLDRSKFLCKILFRSLKVHDYIKFFTKVPPWRTNTLIGWNFGQKFIFVTSLVFCSLKFGTFSEKNMILAMSQDYFIVVAVTKLISTSPPRSYHFIK